MAVEETTTPSLMLEMPRRAAARSRRVERTVPWREAWGHALAAYYRARMGWVPLPRLEAAGILLVWGLFLAGTALGVHVYANSTSRPCWIMCQDPFFREDVAFQAISLAGLGSVLVVAAEMIGAVLRWLYQRRRGRKILGFLLHEGWINGTMALLSITPLGPEGVVRVCFLSHLHARWQLRGPLVMTIGEIGALVVGFGVVFPIFWWLPPWTQWGLLVLLVALWGLVLGVGGQALAAAVSTLHEVDWGSTARRHGPVTTSLNLLSGLALSGAVLAVRGVIGALPGMPHYEANLWTALVAPLLLLALTLPLTALTVQAAQRVLRVRLARHPAAGR